MKAALISFGIAMIAAGYVVSAQAQTEPPAVGQTQGTNLGAASTHAEPQTPPQAQSAYCAHWNLVHGVTSDGQSKPIGFCNRHQVKTQPASVATAASAIAAPAEKN